MKKGLEGSGGTESNFRETRVVNTVHSGPPEGDPTHFNRKPLFSPSKLLVHPPLPDFAHVGSPVWYNSVFLHLLAKSFSFVYPKKTH